MTTLHEAAQKELPADLEKALSKCQDEAIKSGAHESYKAVRDAFAELRKALAQQGEPVAWMVEDTEGGTFIFRLHKPVIHEGEKLTPLYAGAAPAAQPACKQDLPVETMQERYVRMCPDSECGRKKQCARMVGVSCMSRADIAAAPAPQAQQEPAGPDPQLCAFYEVTTFPELVAAQAKHILKLQAKVPPYKDPHPRNYRQG